MTILSRVDHGEFQLFVCGTPSQEWVEWVRTATVPLTPHQRWWREQAQKRHNDAARGLGVPDPKETT